MQIKEMNNLEMDAGSKYTHCFCTNRFYARLNRKKSQSHFIKHLLCYRLSHQLNLFQFIHILKGIFFNISELHNILTE